MSEDRQYNLRPAPMCYLKHPVLQLDETSVYGGSCHDPAKNCSIYVSLDTHVKSLEGVTAYPWEDDFSLRIHYPITNMSVPDDPISFYNMAQWLLLQVEEDVTPIHIGCYAGHGRTGLLLALLLSEFLGTKSVLSTLRSTYCHKAVETAEQQLWLYDNYEIQ